MTAPAFEEVPMPEAEDWMSCKSRRPWVLNSLQSKATDLRSRERRAREAFRRGYMGAPAQYVADAYAEAAAVFEARISALNGIKTGPTTPRECLWTPDADGYWKTACGQGHTFTTDGPTENNHRFCCYCGGRISMDGSGA